MRRWLSAALAALAEVADQPERWMPGALAWLVTVGWIPFAAAFLAPTTSGMTYLGAGVFSSGAWPWNAVAIGVGALVLLVGAFVLATLAEVALIDRGRAGGSERMLRIVGVAAVASAPALLILAGTAVAAGLMAPAEFNAPRAEPGPVVRLAARLLPLIGAAVAAASAGAALHAAASRSLLERDGSVRTALRRGATRLRAAGTSAVAHAVAVLVVRVAYLVLATLLLIVLWAPIGERLEDGIDVDVLLLLVGFVAIWLCLVLGGGAVHAWGSQTWTRVLAGPATNASREAPMQP